MQSLSLPLSHVHEDFSLMAHISKVKIIINYMYLIAITLFYDLHYFRVSELFDHVTAFGPTGDSSGCDADVGDHT